MCHLVLLFLVIAWLFLAAYASLNNRW